MARLTYASARDLCSSFGFDPFEDFHVMSSDSKEAVIRAADSVGYRAPKSRNGSRGRYFAAYVRRIIERGDKSDA